MKRVALVSLLLIAASPVARGPLCRDAKGLFTPCTAAEAMRHDRARMKRAPSPCPVPDGAEASATAAPLPVRARTTRPVRRPAMTKGRLCRDGKGLATPCPR